jgi:stress response protein YsnF
VERVEVNRFVDAPEAVRQEGDVTIVPVMEEVAVVQKRLRVKHELRLTRRRKTHEQTERVVLRNEEAQVLRSDVPPESGRDGTTVANASGSSRQAT